MNIIPTHRPYAEMHRIDFERYRDLEATGAVATKPVREYRIALTAWCTAEVWVKGIDEHDAKEAAHLLWGTSGDRAFTHTDGGIHDLNVLETRSIKS